LGAVEPTHLLFDFFGTLVDYSKSMTEQGYPRSFALARQAGAGLDYAGFLELWSETFDELEAAAATSHREFSMLEIGSQFFERALRGPAPPEVVRALAETYVSEWNQGVAYLAGVPELLDRLSSRYRLAVVSNTHDPALVPGHLAAMGVAGLFERVVTSVECGVRKPSPEIFRHALRELGIPPERCVHIGDSYDADYRGARSAGIRAFLIDPHLRWLEAGDARLDSVFALEHRLADGQVR
jgi:putative hydrolase of the HAD superfamily